jgi:hypothetical protein
MPSGPTAWGRVRKPSRRPIIHVTPQIPAARRGMRSHGQSWTIRSTMGISIAERTMKITRIVSTGEW